MTDYTYNYNKIPSALAQRQALSAEDKPKARPKGIASKPSGEASATGEPDFYDRMLDMLLPYFSSKEDADEVLSNGTPDREALKLASINEFEGLSQEARDAIEQAQQTRIGPADRGDVDVFEEDVITEEAKPKPLVDPKDIAPDLQRMDPKGVTASDFPARPPLEGETTADTGAGLMSKPLTDDDMGLPEDPLPDLITYSTTVDALYSDFTAGGQEGTEAHVGLDEKNITLPAGIVAEGLKYKGVAFKQGDAKVVGFDKDLLDSSGAYKKVSGVTIKRSDYSSDVDFSKAVLEQFESVVKDQAGTDWDALSDGAKKGIVKLAWNNGVEGGASGKGWAGYNTSKALYKTLATATPDPLTVKKGMLNYSTVSGSGASIGVAKNRADAWNAMTDQHGMKAINKITADNTGTKTKFNYYDEDGTLLHTETTSRAPSLYANKKDDGTNNELIEKNAAGEW